MAKKKKKKGITLDGEDTIIDFIPKKIRDELQKKEKERGTHKQDNGQG